MARRKKLKKSKVFNLFLVLSTIFLIIKIIDFGNFENIIRYTIIGIIIVFNLILITNNTKKKSYIKLMIFITILINIIIGLSINKIYSSLSNISNNKTIYSTSLVVLKSNNINNISNLKNIKIGISSDETSIEGYELANEIIDKYNLSKNNTIKSYSTYPEILNDLYDNKIDAALLPSNYKSMFSNIDKFENIDDDLKELETITKKATNKEKKYGTKNINEPFTILLMGIDSTKDGLGNSDSFNGDSLMLVTFNPNTLNATILSIPRDSYVPIMCFKGKYENKITHAAWKGTDCILKTIENFTGIDIDYYAKINFKGLVTLVNELGGITVEVPKDLCTDNSNRNGKVCIKKGIQTLNGEEALVLARNRKQLANGDLDRGINQQVVLQGIIDKAKNIKDVNELLNILNVISNNLDMNMDEDTILSFYNIGKNILLQANNSSDLITLERLYLSGYGQMIYDENTNLVLWNYVLNDLSLKDVVSEMKYNLEIEEPELIKTFNFSIDEPYEKTTIGKGPYKTFTYYELLPDFTGDTKEQALNWGKENNITIEFNEVTKSGYSKGIVIDQNYPYKKRLDKIPNKTITLTITK